MNKFTVFLARTRKALTAGVSTLATGYTLANVDGVVTKEETTYIVGSIVIAVVAVFFVPNRPKSQSVIKENVR